MSPGVKFVRRLFAALAVVAALMGTAWAVQPDEILRDPAMEARAREISSELRCLVCQNQNIAESNASLAQDLKRQVADMLVAGRSDDEIKSYLQARYGDFVLYRPPFKPTTWLLWLTPFVVLIATLLIAVWMLRKRRPEPTSPDSVDREALQRLLDKE